MAQYGFNLQLEGFSKDQMFKAAKLVEDLGLDAVFVNDHYMKPVGNYCSDAFLTLTGISFNTKHVKIGTAVSPISFRQAPITAKIVSTLDNICEGRLIFGVGIGWNKAEFEAYGVKFLPYKERVAKTIEGIRLMKKMWMGDNVTFKGKYYYVKNAVLQPKPIQKPHPPLIIGSNAPKMRKFVACEADGWIPAKLTPKKFGIYMDEILANAEKPPVASQYHS
jgi:alkanesulfonate monooxygenase SsuD/methylene tetrahydromethanopterin reductase-like flavin-dependent oxidoreductase (luciferase family)